MTTDPTPLQERLWDAIYASRSSSIDNEAPTIAIVAAVLPLIAAEVRKGQREAWADGYGAHMYDSIRTDYGSSVNPYREQEN